jgi:antitoxin component YwqK of YwqJK toxin-antitoxin module
MKVQIQKSLLLLLMVASTLSVFAQKKIYLDGSGKKTKAKRAYYYRLVTPEGSSFLVKDYFISNDQLQMEGRYKSKKLESETRDGQFTTFYVNGQKESEGEYNKGKKEGKWTYWYKDGQKISEGKFENGDRQGEWEFFHRNGALKTKPTYLDGEKNGASVFFYDNGDKEEEYNFIKGQKNGDFIEYFKGNKVKQKGKYVKDSLEGAYEFYWENGNLADKGEYSDNKRHGLWEFFHSNGKKSCEVEYKKGKFIKAAFFDEEGVKLSKKVYEEDLVKDAEFTGGVEAQWEIVGKQIGKKVDLAGAKRDKYNFICVITLTIDTEGNVIDREWNLPDVDDDSYDDKWLVVKNINAAIDDFPKFQPEKAYNRLVETTYILIWGYDFSKYKGN